MCSCDRNTYQKKVNNIMAIPVVLEYNTCTYVHVYLCHGNVYHWYLLSCNTRPRGYSSTNGMVLQYTCAATSW